MNITSRKSTVDGCSIANIPKIDDERGYFLKFYQKSCFEEYLNGFTIAESYISKSKKGVLRGMHFQVPPSDHAKVVICLDGDVHDVFVDIRNGSSFGNYDTVGLSHKNENAIFLPAGIAHGFLTLSEEATLLYLVSTEYDPKNDQGIMWNSFGYSWPCKNPITSTRDQKHKKLQEFKGLNYWK